MLAGLRLLAVAADDQPDDGDGDQQRQQHGRAQRQRQHHAKGHDGEHHDAHAGQHDAREDGSADEGDGGDQQAAAGKHQAEQPLQRTVDVIAVEVHVHVRGADLVEEQAGQHEDEGEGE